MDKFEVRAVMKYLNLKGMSSKEIHEDMIQTLGKDAPFYSMVKKWVAEFKKGKEDVTDESRAGRPVDVVTDEQSKAVHRALMSDRRVTTRKLAKTLGINKGSIQTILSGVLHMKKLSAR